MAAMKPVHQFDGTIGEPSVGIGGPDQIEADLDMYDIMFDPQRTHNDEDETPGGIHEENMQDDAASDRVIGDRTINDNESLDGFSGTGKLTKLLSVVGRILKAVTGKGSWFSLPDTSISALNTRMGTAETNIVTVTSGLNTHKSSTDHDSRYYTKQELEGYLRGGDTKIREEVYTIISANNGDGTFTYKDDLEYVYSGTIDEETGFQVFELQKGTYPTGENKVTVFINDTLRRSAISGGLIEISENEIGISPEGNGAEITIFYYERIGLMGEHAITHQSGGTDIIVVDEAMLQTALKNKLNGKITGVGVGKITVSASPPSNPSAGDIWIDISL